MRKKFLTIVSLMVFSLSGNSDGVFSRSKDPDFTTMILEPTLLQKLQANGFSFSEIINQKKLPNNSMAEISREKNFKIIFDQIAEDLDEDQKDDPLLGVTMKSSHRLFNKGWLYSPAAFLELVAVVNRFDRAPFNAGSGEIRFIYRLAYAMQVPKLYSRLPLTFNVVFSLPSFSEQQLAEITRRWQFSETKTKMEYLISNAGPLAEIFFQAQNLKSVELNMQSVRWPSTIRPDMGGYAEYLMRVFKKSATGDFYPAKMENTPDLKKILADNKSKQQLLKFLKQPETIQKIDRGVLVVPEQYLATKVKSVALHGLNRLANRPYQQLFTESDFNDIELKHQNTIKSASTLLRRLDDHTCMGCHQGRTIAGFHIVGNDPKTTIAVNSVFLGISPHLMNDLPRRSKYLQNLAVQSKPNESRAFSERSEEEKGSFGAHCALPVPNNPYAKWQCARDLQCQSITSAHAKQPWLGQCFPKKKRAGSPCQTGTVSQNPNSHKDKVLNKKDQSCGVGNVCEASSVGFPSGMCSGSCANLGRGEICGSIANLFGFNHCLARNEPFDFCLENNVRPGALASCTADQPCRDDYVCASLPRNNKQGACIPPYFLFQLRVDGHPSP